MHIEKAAADILKERFGKDSLMALATAADNIPHARTVNACYEDGSFYVITYALSGKMRQIAQNPVVALSGEWFSAHGKARSLGWFGAAENARIAARLRRAFALWIDNGHNNFDDHNTIILRIDLTDGLLWAQGVRYELGKES